MQYMQSINKYVKYVEFAKYVKYAYIMAIPVSDPKVDVHPRCFYQMVDPASSKNCTVLSDIQIRIFLSCQEEPAIHYISHKRPRHHEESIPTGVRRIRCYGFLRKTRSGAYHVELSLFPRCYIECQT